jgi:hypothetical protein
MTQEEKNLLVKDLCARLPYGLYIQDEYGDIVYISYNDVHFANYFDSILNGTIKPYLFPMSSMTEEQIEELKDLISQETNILIEQLKNDDCGIDCGKYHFHSTLELDWLLKNHFDFRCLIPMGLALDATGLDVY